MVLADSTMSRSGLFSSADSSPSLTLSSVMKHFPPLDGCCPRICILLHCEFYENQNENRTPFGVLSRISPVYRPDSTWIILLGRQFGSHLQAGADSFSPIPLQPSRPSESPQEKKLHHSSHIRLIRWTQPTTGPPAAGSATGALDRAPDI